MNIDDADNPSLPRLYGMTPAEVCGALVELCDRGFLTCTRGKPGEPDATYALAWLPLDNPDAYPVEIRERHAANMQKLGFGDAR